MARLTEALVLKDDEMDTPVRATPVAGDARVPLHVLAVIFVSIALLVINASLLIINTGRTMDTNAHYARSYEIKRALSTFQSVITAAESGQRGYLLTGDTEYLSPYYRAMRSWRLELDRLANLTADNPERQRDIAELERYTAAAIQRLEQTIERSPNPGPSGTADLAGTSRATETMDRVRSIVERLLIEEDARIDALGKAVLRDVWITLGVALLTTIVTVAVLVGLNKLLQRYVAARARAETALLEANQHLNQLVEQRTSELAELSQHLIRVAEEEKAKLARELHDTFGSNLTAINMDLNWIQRRIPEDAREVRERLQRVLQVLAETVELKHEVIEGLRPSHLDSFGLAYAIRSYCRECSRRTGLPCDVEVTEDFDDIDASWSIALYRIPAGDAHEHRQACAGNAGARHACTRAKRHSPARHRRRCRDCGRRHGQTEVARHRRHARAHASTRRAPFARSWTGRQGHCRRGIHSCHRASA